MHYERIKRNGSTDLVERAAARNTPCSVDGCTSNVLAGGFCSMHYQRAYKHGSADTKLKPGPRRPPIKELILSRVAFVPESGCWLWTGATSADGNYGRIRFNGIPHNAHRLMWETENGPIPDGMILCHRCDIGLCCNPNHLFLGTHQDNSDDKVRKGRQSRGDNHGSSKLSANEVALIRGCTESAHFLAEKYDVHRSTIYAIRNNLYWKHVP